MNLLRAVGSWFLLVIPSLLLITGGGLVVAGVSLLNGPAGLVTAGVLILADLKLKARP